MGFRLAESGPLYKAKETVRTFARGRPRFRDLLASRSGTFDRAHAILPSDAVVGEGIDLTVQVWDEYERLHPEFSGTFRVGSTDDDADLPERVRFAPGDDAPVVRQRGIAFATPGVQYLTLTREATGERFVSNPVRVHAEDPAMRTYWGDIHLHSVLSDGTGSVERGLRYGREVMALDVVAYTDHDTMGFFIPPSRQRKRMHRRLFERTLDAIEAANDPGEYVTLPAYEWTKQPNVGGHINVYFDSVEHAELFDSHHPATDTYEKLWARLREYNESDAHDGRALSIPHHPAESMYPFDFSAVEYDDEVAPLVEVYSQWGSSERPGRAGNRFPLEMGQGEVGEDGYYTRDAHDLGYRVGLTASSDYHGPHPGHSLIHAKPHLPSLADWRDGGLGWSNIWRVWNEGSYPGGLQALRASELTREAVFEAMTHRRVYGTTQPDRILVGFAVEGVEVGARESTVTVEDATAAREVSVSVAGTAPIESVVVVKNGEDWRTDERDADDSLAAYTLDTAWTDEVPAGDAEDHADYYYVRVHQHDDGMAWAGPLWVEVAGPRPSD